VGVETPPLVVVVVVVVVVVLLVVVVVLLVVVVVVVVLGGPTCTQTKYFGVIVQLLVLPTAGLYLTKFARVRPMEENRETILAQVSVVWVYRQPMQLLTCPL